MVAPWTVGSSTASPSKLSDAARRRRDANLTFTSRAAAARPSSAAPSSRPVCSRLTRVARYTSTATNAIVASATTAAKMVPASIRFRCSRNTVGPTDLRSSNGSGSGAKSSRPLRHGRRPRPLRLPSRSVWRDPRPRSPGCRSAKTSRWARFCPAIDGVSLHIPGSPRNDPISVPRKPCSRWPRHGER